MPGEQGEDAGGAPGWVRCLVKSLTRWPMTALQPASTLPEPMNMLSMR